MTSASLAKLAPSKFYPPLPKRWLVWLIHRLSGSIAHWGYRMALEISETEVAKLKPLRGDRVVFFANHPTFGEPVLMYDLSSRLGEQFYYMGAYELFKGAMQHFFQGLGVYSIRRGLVDRQSIKQTIEIVRQPGSRLVIFPEGRCSFQSDRLMEFQPGGVQLAFKALSKLSQQESESPDLYAVPVSIHYQYQGDLSEVVEETLAELEAVLELPSFSQSLAESLSPEASAQLPAQAYGRLRRIAQALLQRIEADYESLNFKLPTLDEGNWNERLQALRDAILEHCESLLELPTNLNQPRRDRAYRIQAALVDYEAQTDAAEHQSPEALPAGDSVKDAAFPIDLIKRSVERLLNLDTIYDGYVLENPTPERFIDAMSRFQRELFQIDQPKPKRNRKAHMTIGEPINLRDYLADYKSDRNGTVNVVCGEIRDRMQANLTRMVTSAEAKR